MSSQLSNKEIMIIVYRYIGVEGGYLGDFSYRTHEEFYPLYCDLQIDPYKFEGTTRERFIKILSSQQPKDQAKIIRGVLDRFPLDAEQKPKTRTQSLYDELRLIASRIEIGEEILTVSLDTSYNVVLQALHDAEILMQNSSASSVVDRIITALYGYMESVLSEANIAYVMDAPITSLFKILRDNHPAFQNFGHRAQDIRKILITMSAIIDALQPVRNKASLAHPNDLLDVPEAMLVINSTRTILNYLDCRIKLWKNRATSIDGFHN